MSENNARYGKSPCDGIGGTIKQLSAWASLQATMANQILTAAQLFEWPSKRILGVKLFFVSANYVAENEVKFGLVSRFASAKTVPGTWS